MRQQQRIFVALMGEVPKMMYCVLQMWKDLHICSKHTLQSVISVFY